MIDAFDIIYATKAYSLDLSILPCLPHDIANSAEDDYSSQHVNGSSRTGCNSPTMQFFQAVTFGMIGESAFVLLTLTIHNCRRMNPTAGGWEETAVQDLNRGIIMFFLLQVAFITILVFVWIMKNVFRPALQSTLCVLDDLRELLHRELP